MDFVSNLRRRAEILRQIRAFFDERGFVEVTTPVAIDAPAPEPHIDCPTAGGCKFLRASPELQMKKLLAAGMDKIYQIGPCFREGEIGTRHNPEFTMIEWYRRKADYRDIMSDMEKLISQLFHAIPTVRTGRAPRPAIPTARTGRAPRPAVPPPSISFRRLSVREAYQKFAGWDPWEGEWDQDRFDYDMATKVESNLGEGFVFLTDYPPQAASLSRLRGDVAERWELYYNGIELANCFTELCDGPEQRRRFLAAKKERRSLGESDYPLDEEFLALVPLMESAAGVALGVDRLVAVLCGESDIHSVMCGE